MIDATHSLVAPASTDRRRPRRCVPALGRLDGHAHSPGRAAGSDGADGDHPRRSAGHGSARDRIAGHVPDRIGAQRRGWRPARAVGDRGRCRRRLGRVRLGAGHQPRPPDGHREADARLRSLPPNVEPPFLAPVSSIMGEVLFIDLESDRHSPLEVRTIAETVVRRRLLAVPGVSQVIATGGEQKQYEVVLDPVRLAAQQVTLEEVEAALDRRQPERHRGIPGGTGAGVPRARRRTARRPSTPLPPSP